MTVIDPKTGQSLWTDSRRWGSLRVRGATKDLIGELRQQMEEQTKKWRLNEILMCGLTPVYAGFAHLSPEEALAKSDGGTAKVSGTTDRLILSSPDAPPFCQRAQFIFGSERRIIGFEVFASRTDDLDVGEVLQQADLFDFSGGKYAGGDQVFFNAQSKDKKILIQFRVDGRAIHFRWSPIYTSATPQPTVLRQHFQTETAASFIESFVRLIRVS